jgi:uncharacterized protein YkwD
MKNNLLNMVNVLFLFFSFLASASASDCGEMNISACSMYEKINGYRIQAGVAPLGISDKCTVSAQDHAEDMINRDFFSHHSPTETFGERVKRHGFRGSTGENIAMASSLDRVFNNWLKSRGHRKNILKAKYKNTGLGYKNQHWVQCFTSEID